MEKTCTGCGVTLPATTEHFHRHPCSPDGLKPRCKRCQCRAEAERYTRKSDVEKAEYKARVLSWRSSNRVAVGRTGERWRLANRAKRRAHDIVQRALRAGALAKAPCEACGAPDVQAHHDDYSRPRDVRWLCSKHHAAHHVEERRRKAAS